MLNAKKVLQEINSLIMVVNNVNLHRRNTVRSITW